MTAKKQTSGPAKKSIQGHMKKDEVNKAEPIDYKVYQTIDARTHQFVVSIFRKITWKSEIGNKEEWKEVRSWRIGMKAGFLLQQIISSLDAVAKQIDLPPAKPYSPPVASPRSSYSPDREGEEEGEDY